MINKLSIHSQAFLGKKNKCKILVIESDDWGLMRIPSQKAFKNLLNAGIKVNKCSFNRFDALETSEDINVLNDFCNLFKDKNGKPLKLTTNFIMANPNFEMIRNDNFCKYHYRDLSKTYEFYQGNNQTILSIKDAINNNIIIPQLHGREHLQVNFWLSALRSNDIETKLAFDNGVWGHPSVFGKKTGINFLSAFHINNEKDLEFAKESLFEASILFKDEFGFNSETFIAPRYIWPRELESTYKKIGIKAIQGKIVQLSPRINGRDSRLNLRINWMGKSNVNGLNYLIRNVFFEPSVSPNFSWEKDAIKRIETAFFWGKPAVISMHRLNFMGGFSKENRTNGINRLFSLIQAVQKKHPDLVFMSSNELNQFIYGVNFSS